MFLFFVYLVEIRIKVTSVIPSVLSFQQLGAFKKIKRLASFCMSVFMLYAISPESRYLVPEVLPFKLSKVIYSQ